MRLALDIGFGHTKYAFYKSNELIFGKIPSVLAKTQENLKELSQDALEYQEVAYYAGNLALKANKNKIIDIDNYNKLELYSPLLIAEVIKENNLNDVDEIICGLSPAHKDNNGAYKNSIKDFIISKKEYCFNIGLLPQGVGAVKFISSNLDKFKDMKDVKDYLLVDIGFNTTDMVFVYNGNIQKGKINKDNSFENTGVTLMAKEASEYIRKAYNKTLSLDQCLEATLKGGFRHRGEWFDMGEPISVLRKNYASRVMEFLEQNYYDELDNMEKICFVGGGAYFIDKNYAKNIVVFENSEYMNVLGNLNFDSE